MDNNPQPAWPPYSGDCSPGICSYNCPQWCFFLFPPPPPSPPTSHSLSPLLIAVIAVVSTASVLIAYYLILAHYRRTRGRSSVLTAGLPDNPPWHAARRDGLDESLIDKIAACRYRAGGGLIVDGTDCSVCLSQFEDGDHVRLLPKCSHPFHLGCIDTWLKSHSTCPLCRAGIFPLPMPPDDTLIGTTTIIVVESEESRSGSDTTASTENENHDTIEIGEGQGVIGRSLSMDSMFWRRAGLNSNSSTRTDTDTDTSPGTWSRALHSVMISPVRMKRSRSLTSILPT